MKKVKVSFDTYIQLLGMIGVLGGLVFVGLEMQQTQKIAIAGQVQARTEMAVERMLSPLEGNIDAVRLYNSNNFDYGDLNENEKLIADQLHAWKRSMLENNFFQYKAGLFDDEHWEQTEVRIQSWWNNCEMRPSGQQIASFQAYLDSLPDNCEE